MTTRGKLSTGVPWPLGATCDDRGANFSIFSANAEKVELCLFDNDGSNELRIELPERTGDVWHGHVSGVMAGRLYGYRVYGPYDPRNGHRFNPHKLLIDPYARALDRPFEWSDIHCGYIVGDSRQDLSFDKRDNADRVPKGRIFAQRTLRSISLNRPMHDSVIYELHIRGYTMRHPSPAKNVRGTLAGLSHPDVVQHIRSLGVTAIELLPIHAIATTKRLSQLRLRDYWGYNSINFFAIEPRYLSAADPGEFPALVKTFHDAGIEVILDVVFNHSGEGDEFGPTLSFRGIDNASYYSLAEDKRRYLDVTGCKNTLNIAHPQVLQMVLDSLRYWAQMGVDGFRFDLAVALGRENRHFSPGAAFFAAVSQDPTLSHLKLIAEPWDLGVGGYQLGAFPRGWGEWNDRFRDTARRFWRGDQGMVADLAYRLSGSSDVFKGSGRGPSASINYVTSHDGFTLEDLASYTKKNNAANGEDNSDGSDENFNFNSGAEGPNNDASILAARRCYKRNLLATLLLSAGVPMLLAGDEMDRTQMGNNNAYCQDNDISWVDWRNLKEDDRLARFVIHLLELRRTYPFFARKSFFTGEHIDGTGLPDIGWRLPNGNELTETDWSNAGNQSLGVYYPSRKGGDSPSFMLLLNASQTPVEFVLPTLSSVVWHSLVDTNADDVSRRPIAVGADSYRAMPQSLILLAGLPVSRR